MKKYILLLIVFMLFAMGCASNKIENEPYNFIGSYTSLPPSTENQKFYEYGNGFLIFTLLDSSCFYLKNSEPKVTCFIDYKEYGKSMEEHQDYFIKKIKIDNVMVPVSSKQLDPVVNGNTRVVPLEVKVGEKIFVFNFNVQEVPVSLGMTYEEIIEILGQPNDEKKSATDTWSVEYRGDPDFNRRYRSYWELVYDKFLGKKLYLNQKGILEGFY